MWNRRPIAPPQVDGEMGTPVPRTGCAGNSWAPILAENRRKIEAANGVVYLVSTRQPNQKGQDGSAWKIQNNFRPLIAAGIRDNPGRDAKPAKSRSSRNSERR